MTSQTTYGRCASCRGGIPFGARFYRCSVSTCNLGKLKLLFCCRACWEEHVPVARHRDASFVEETAPDAPS